MEKQTRRRPEPGQASHQPRKAVDSNMADYYRAVIELSHGLVATLDPEGKILNVNSRMEAVSGRRLTEVSSRDWFEAFVPGEDRSAARRAFGQAMTHGGTVRRQSRMVTRKGETRFVDWNYRVVLNSRGKTNCVLCVGQDVTVHVENRRRLQQERHALIEKNRELTCLYGMTRVFDSPDAGIDEILGKVVALIPAAFRFPECAAAGIFFDQRVFRTTGFEDSPLKLTAPIEAAGLSRGRVDVVYRPTHGRDAAHRLSFLDEEIKLLKTVAKQLALMIARKEALATQLALEGQLRHADRLAKIGQFAAGVAHELNEPLANILGFAQLAAKAPQLPAQVGRDLENIVKSSLHAREIIKKLLLFSRQIPLRMIRVDLNRMVTESLYFTESSCAKHGITVVCRLAPDLPCILADPQHLKQVIVNLVVNAIHAMPEGGTLSLETASLLDGVYLMVTDTGSGMDTDTLRQIFNPFFTTKDVDQGTGLGLSVVHGIVKSHGGIIEVQSRPAQGTRVEIAFPVGTVSGGVV